VPKAGLLIARLNDVDLVACAPPSSSGPDLLLRAYLVLLPDCPHLLVRRPHYDARIARLLQRALGRPTLPYEGEARGYVVADLLVRPHQADQADQPDQPDRAGVPEAQAWARVLAPRVQANGPASLKERASDLFEYLLPATPRPAFLAGHFHQAVVLDPEGQWAYAVGLGEGAWVRLCAEWQDSPWQARPAPTQNNRLQALLMPLGVAGAIEAVTAARALAREGRLRIFSQPSRPFQALLTQRLGYLVSNAKSLEYLSNNNYII
jgi:hypothetical protein